MSLVIKQRAVTVATDLPETMDPVLKRIYAVRGVTTADELDYSLDALLNFEGLRNIHDAAALLATAIRRQQRIVIVADFDADGATSCVVAMRSLAGMSAGRVTYVVPNRFEYGYGLSPEIVDVAAGHDPDLLITVDNGIASIAGVAHARDLGIDVLITDHHLPGEALPDANVIVNPNQAGDTFKSKALAGVGVIFYVMLAVRHHLRADGWFDDCDIPVPNLSVLLDLVALGTVADVVPLDHNNRLLVAQGLRRIRTGRCCPGIKALLRLARRSLSEISEKDLAFAVAPRLNAAGRLEDMSQGIACLLSDNGDEAHEMAAALDTLNRKRRAIQHQMQLEAQAEIEALEIGGEDIPLGVCLFNAHWHQGVVGIISSKIKERLNRPVIAFAEDKAGLIKGSARSIQGVHIRDVLATVDSHMPGLIHKFGGHAMAAGLSIQAADLNIFRSVFNDMLKRFVTAEDLSDAIYSDGTLVAGEISIQLATTILAAGPWGADFPEPLFSGVFERAEARRVGEKHLTLSLRLPDDDTEIDAIAFNTTDEDWPHQPEQVHIAYRLDINQFRGQRQLQLIVETIEAVV